MMIAGFLFRERRFARRSSGWPATVMAAALCVSSALAGDVTRYTFEVPDRLDAAYDVALDVRFAGRVVVDAQWGGGRILSFRIEGAGSPPVRVLRSGPSPQRIEAAVSAASSSIGAPWRLVIRALPGRGATQVALAVEVPQPPPATHHPQAALEESLREAEAAPLEAWARPASPKEGTIPRLVPLFQSIERFRVSVVGPTGEFVSDPCSWHANFLRRVASLRDSLAGTAVNPSAADAACLSRIAGAVRRVDESRNSADPLLAGPVPEDATERIVWRARRGDRLRPLEESLAAMLADSRTDACPALRDEAWPPRFAACLIACERYFEERVRAGEDAPNAELAKSEWGRFLEAALVLEQLAALNTGAAPSAE